MALIIAKSVEQKIAQDDHGNISLKDVEECVENHNGKFCTDPRPQHASKSGAPTLWFVGETNHGRKLKIMFVREGPDMHLKTAYPATSKIQSMFARYAN
jgi:hypothetical protein